MRGGKPAYRHSIRVSIRVSIHVSIPVSIHGLCRVVGGRGCYSPSGNFASGVAASFITDGVPRERARAMAYGEATASEGAIGLEEEAKAGVSLDS